MGIIEEKEKAAEGVLKAIMAKKLPNLWREMDIQIHECQRTPDRLNLHKTTQDTL